MTAGDILLNSNVAHVRSNVLNYVVSMLQNKQDKEGEGRGGKRRAISRVK